MHIQLSDPQFLRQLHGIVYRAAVAIRHIGVKIGDAHFIIQVKGIVNSELLRDRLQFIHIQHIQRKLGKIDIQFEELQSQFPAQFRPLPDGLHFHHGGHS